MVAAFCYSACFQEGDMTVVMLRPTIVNLCQLERDQAQLLEEDFHHLSRQRGVILDFTEVQSITPDGLRVLRMFKRAVDVHGGTLILRKVRNALLLVIGKYFWLG